MVVFDELLSIIVFQPNEAGQAGEQLAQSRYMKVEQLEGRSSDLLMARPMP